MVDQTAPARRCAVVAHYDVRLLLARHVQMLLEELLAVCDEVVVVSSSGMDVRSLQWASRHPHLKVVIRDNAGYDFMSYKVGLEHLGDLDGVELIVCNDSYVGPVVPMAEMLSRMESSDCDFWGMTENYAPTWHLQSYFLVFRPAAVAHPEFRSFWDDVEELSDRHQVILRYELGLSERLVAAGLHGDAYFIPTAKDVWEVCGRRLWWHTPEGPDGVLPVWQEVTRRLYDNAEERHRFNSTVMLADRILDKSLPILKLEVARLDPIGLGGDWLLKECTRRYPRWFSRVEQYLRESDGATYDGRHGSVPRIPHTLPIEQRVAYHSPEGHS